MAKQELTRKMVYDLVWSKPMTKVAEDLGISDVGLKKICVKHRVPTPPRGYWAKKEAGKPVGQTRLHGTDDPQDERIVIHGSRNNLPPDVKEVVDQERERRKARPKPSATFNSTSVESVQDVHRAVAATARKLRHAKPNADGVVHADGSGHCGIEAGADSVERVVLILDQLARGLEERGLVLEPTGSAMRVGITPDAITLSLLERVERREHVPTLEELAKEERIRKKRERDVRFGVWSFSQERAYPEFDFVRTGELGIQIDDQYVRGLRRSWRDGRRQRVESLVDDIVGGIVAYLAGVKSRREERERRQREWRSEQRLRELARAREKREESRREFLQHYVAIQTEAGELRALLNGLKPSAHTAPSGEFQRLIAWAEARLEHLESQLIPEGISAALEEKNLFPEPDDLVAPADDVE